MKIKIRDINSAIVLKTIGPSGSVFFHSLLDNHKELLNIPIYSHCDYFIWVEYIEKKIKLEPFEKKIDLFIESFVKNYIFIFDFTKTVSKEDSFNNAQRKSANELFLTQECDKKINIAKFKQKAKELLLEHKEINKSSLLKAIYLAYHYSVYNIDSFDKVPKVVFDIHCEEYNEYVNLLGNHFENIKGLINLRQPDKIIESFARRPFLYEILSKEKSLRLPERGKFIYKFFLTYGMKYLKEFASCNINVSYLRNTRVIILEDLHNKTDMVLNSVCKFLDISYSESLKESTFNNQPWTWIPEAKKHNLYNKKGFGISKFESIEYLTKKQRDAINFTFSSLCEKYNIKYNENYSLKELEEVLEDGFEFEKKLYEIEVFDDLDPIVIRTINKAHILEFLYDKDFWSGRTLPKNILEE